MLELLDQIDKILFLLINVHLANPVTDAVMPIVTSDQLLRIGYGLFMVAMVAAGPAKLRWAVLFSGIVLTFSDQISANFLKHYFERPRPCHVLEQIHLLVGCGGGYAMPSAHAANSLAQAGFFAVVTPSSRKWLIPLALLIASSRVFVGVHYPGDVLIGSAVGWEIGRWLGKLFQWLRRKGRLWKVPHEMTVAEKEAAELKNSDEAPPRTEQLSEPAASEPAKPNASQESDHADKD